MLEEVIKLRRQERRNRGKKEVKRKTKEERNVARQKSNLIK
jgi:hypothetical protein